MATSIRTTDCYVTSQRLRPLLLSFSRRIPQLKFLRNELSTEAIDDGYMNQVYRLREISNNNHIDRGKNDASSVIIKQASSENKLSQMCCDLRFDIFRGQLEYLALSRFHELLPESVPKPHLYDEPSKILVMEDLHHHVPLRQALINGNITASVLCKTARYLANLHRGTSQSYLGETDFAQLKKTFENPIHVELSRQFTFAKPFCSTDPSNKTIQELRPHLAMVYEDDDILNAVKELEMIFLERKECLVHGDFHTGSVMVHNEDAKIIDVEFSHVGASAGDMGTFLAHVLFSNHAHRLCPKDRMQDFHELIKQAIQESMRIYLNEFPLQEKKLSEIAGFTGLQLVRCIIGMAITEDILDKPKAELACYFTGISLLKSYQKLTTEEEFVTCLFRRNYDHGLPNE